MKELRYDLHIASTHRQLVAVRDFVLAESSITVLFGESGIGKSLSALAIAGLIDPDQLDVRLNGREYGDYLHSRELLDIRRNGFFVFQEPSSHLNPLMTLGSQLREGTLVNPRNEGEILKRLWPGSSSLSVQNILDVYPKPYRPSGGEKQRVLAAMAFKRMSELAGSTPGALFIFDEPTGSLDNRLRDEFLDLLVEKFRVSNATVLLITHDYTMISHFTSAFPDLAKRIVFKELLQEHGKLRLREFHASEYLDWIGTRKTRARAAAQGGEILKLEPSIRVFGLTLLVTRDEAGKMAEPLVIRKGSMVYLKAPSGIGKTTLAKVMMGLQRAEKMVMRLGGVEYNDRSAQKSWSERVWGRQMTMVFQHADEALNLNSSVKDVFAGLPLWTALDTAGIANILSEFFEENPDRGFLRKPVKYLSGGQKQRLNLLRSLVLDTNILILDEPLNGLDFASSVRVLSKIEDRLRRGMSVLVISHNEEIFDALVAPENTYYLQSVA
jgi:peptide/nickel transport system ATP-binding protein